MKDRETRLSAIRELIGKNKIENQETLLQMLRNKGYDVTQATLSRDLKILKVGKVSSGWSGYYYTLPHEENFGNSEKNFIQDVKRGILSIEFSGSIGVIKTRAGNANSVCYALDVLDLPEILGTIAGDDTIFVVLREGMTKDDLLEDFRKMSPESEN